jgi:hypothetical protein
MLGTVQLIPPLCTFTITTFAGIFKELGATKSKAGAFREDKTPTFAPHDVVEQLVAIAHAQNGQAHIENSLVECWSVGSIARPRASADDDSAILPCDLLRGRVEGNNL